MSSTLIERAGISSRIARMIQPLQALQSWPWLETLRTLSQRFREDRLGVTASSLTFTTLIALVPLLTVMLAAFSAFPMFGAFQSALEKYFLQNLVPDNIAKPVLGALTMFASKANRLGVAGLAVLVVTALALMLTIDRTLNAIWRVPRPRPFAQRVLVYWAATTLGPLILGVSLSLTSGLLSGTRGIFGPGNAGVNFLLDSIEFGLMVFGLAGLFHYVPNTHVRWRHAFAGAVFASVGFELAKKLLVWWVSRVPTYSVLYGTLASLPIFLVWIYLGWVIVLLGAVVAAYAPSLRMRVRRRAETPGHRFELALVLIHQLLAAREGQQHGLSLADLSQRLGLDPLQIEPVVEALVKLDWAGRLEERGDQRYVLMCEPQTTPVQPLVAELLLDPSAPVRAFWQRAGIQDMQLSELLA